MLIFACIGSPGDIEGNGPPGRLLLITLIIFFSMNVLVNLFLLVGAYKKNRRLLFVWLTYTFVVIAILAILGAIYDPVLLILTLVLGCSSWIFVFLLSLTMPRTNYEPLE